MSDLVIREIISGTLVTFSKPFKRFGIQPIGGRTTAVRLSNSSVWLLASTPLTDETRQKIDALGQVRYIAVADTEHTVFTKEYSKAYPEAKIFGPEGTAKKLELNILEFKADGYNPMENEDQVLRSEMKAEYFDGFVNKDIAFLHVPSKTLIEADLLFNLPANEQYSKSNESPTGFMNRFFAFQPRSTFHQRFLYNVAGVNKASMARSANKVDQWDFERIIPCHGDVIETDGKAAWRSAFSLYFKDIADGKFPGVEKGGGKS